MIEKAATNMVKKKAGCVARKKGGPPIVVTLALVQRVCHLMARGIPQKDACLAAGVVERSFMSAIRRRAELRPAVDQARADFIAGAVEKIESGVKNWQSLAWLLERRYRELFARGTDVQVNNAIVIGLGQEDLKRIREVAASFTPADEPARLEGGPNE
jgi:hypothetical protein